jgi:hypothetical protein
MIRLDKWMIPIQIALTAMLAAGAGAGRAEDWAASVEVRQDENLCVTYHARRDGPWLVVRATVQPGWHTFAMDNKVRAEEALAGKPSLGIDRATEITLAGGLQVAGSWYQTTPTDFSRPQLRWFSWGFEKEALFAAKVRELSSAAVRIGIRGQACTETVCKNIAVSFSLPPRKGNHDSAPSALHLKDLIPVR